MIVEGSYTFDGPREAVWALLLDPDVLSKALPGSKGLERVEEGRYEGRMHVGVGPVTAAEFTVSVTITDPVHPERYGMTVDGKGPIGFTRGDARVELAETDGDRTLMSYRAELQVGGKIAGVGQRMIDSVGKAMTKQGLEALNRELRARLEAEAPGVGTAVGPAGAASVPALRRPNRLAMAVGVVLFVAMLFVLCGPLA